MYCVYQITNKINGNRYIGQHKYEDESNPMGRYKGSGLLLHKAYKKYGIENFETEILYKRVRDKATIDAMEIWAIEKYKPEYNIAKGGSGGDTYHYVDEETQMRMKQLGHSGYNRGKPHSEEVKAKISKSGKGKKHNMSKKGHKVLSEKAKLLNENPEKIEKQRLSLLKYYETHDSPTKGKHHDYYSRGNKGMHWYTNGTDNVCAFECPEGYYKGVTRDSNPRDPITGRFCKRG